MLFRVVNEISVTSCPGKIHSELIGVWSKLIFNLFRNAKRPPLYPDDFDSKQNPRALLVGEPQNSDGTSPSSRVMANQDKTTRKVSQFTLDCLVSDSNGYQDSHNDV